MQATREASTCAAELYPFMDARRTGVILYITSSPDDMSNSEHKMEKNYQNSAAKGNNVLLHPPYQY